MDQNKIIDFIGKYVSIGVRIHSRHSPFFFFGRLLEVGEGAVLIELNDGSGYKSIDLNEVVDFHLDPKYNKKEDFFG